MNIKSLDLPFAISPSTPFMELHLHEVGMRDYSRVEFLTNGVDGNKKIIVKFERFVAARMQTFWGDFGGMSIGEIVNSTWLGEYKRIARGNFPNSPLTEVKHFFFVGHDVCVEVLAGGITWEEIRGQVFAVTAI